MDINKLKKDLLSNTVEQQEYQRDVARGLKLLNYLRTGRVLESLPKKIQDELRDIMDGKD